MTSMRLTLGQLAYDAWGKAARVLDPGWEGAVLPPWDALPEPIRAAWQVAADAVVAPVRDWAMVNEIAAPPLDWAGLGAITRAGATE